MLNIIRNELLAKLPGLELCDSLDQFLQTFTAVLPEARLRAVADSCVTSIAPGPNPPSCGCATWGELGLKSDLNGPYVLLRGMSAVWQTVATLTFAATHPFPHEATCG